MRSIALASCDACVAFVTFIALLAGAARSPRALGAQDPILPHGRRYWVGASVLLGGALLAEQPLRRFAAAHQSPGLDQVASAVDPLGRAQYLVPALAAGAVLPRLVGDRSFANAALRVGLGYASADLAGGALRFVVGRHRPDSTGDAWRFRPFHPGGQWGSMPSAHVTHAFAIASGIAEASGRPWAAGVAYGVASLVAMQRVYRQAHWASDVVVGAALSTAVSRGVVRIRF